MIAVWTCTSGSPVIAAGSTTQEAEVVNQEWNPVYVEIVD